MLPATGGVLIHCITNLSCDSLFLINVDPPSTGEVPDRSTDGEIPKPLFGFHWESLLSYDIMMQRPYPDASIENVKLGKNGRPDDNLLHLPGRTAWRRQ